MSYSWMAAIRTLAAMHRINPSAVGLDGYGKPADFYKRQLRSLAGISMMQAQIEDKKTGKEVGPIPKFEEMVDWFKKNLPKDENTIVHGDYKIDNIVSLSAGLGFSQIRILTRLRPTDLPSDRASSDWSSGLGAFHSWAPSVRPRKLVAAIHPSLPEPIRCL